MIAIVVVERLEYTLAYDTVRMFDWIDFFPFVSWCNFDFSPQNLWFNSFFLFLFSHIPKAKATAIADTPELKRIAENTKIQSNVKYHADFEKQKGKLTQVRIYISNSFNSIYQLFNVLDWKKKMKKRRKKLKQRYLPHTATRNK